MIKSIGNHDEAGFTLLEVLAALVVFGLLLLALGQGMQFGLQAWRGQARDAAWPDQIESLDRTLRRLVARALSADEVQPGGPIHGGPGVLDVVARLPRPEGGPPVPTEARLEVDGSHRLILRLLPRLNVRYLTPPRADLIVLAERVDRIEFAYWQGSSGSGGGWQREWSGPALPALVRIRLRFPPGDIRHWPDIVVAPLLAGFAERERAPSFDCLGSSVCIGPRHAG